MRRNRPDEDERRPRDEDERRPRKKKKEKKHGSRVGLFVGLALGAAAVWLKIREFTR